MALPESTPTSAVNTIVAGFVGVVSLAQIGGIVYLVKMVIAPLSTTVQQLAESVKLLFQAKNDHEARIVRTETIHLIKGCDKPE